MRGSSTSYSLSLTLVIVLGYLFASVTLGLFNVPVTQVPTVTSPPNSPTATSPPNSPTATSPPNSPTATSPPISPTATSPPNPPTVTSSPTEEPLPVCMCTANEQPIYDTFPHPQHTNESHKVFNFYNDGAIDGNGRNMTVWVTLFIIATKMTVFKDSRFREGFAYVYVDARPVARGELFSYTVSRDITANGGLYNGHVYIYYEDPATHDVLRNTRYNGTYPVQTANNIVPITTVDNHTVMPSSKYAQKFEFDAFGVVRYKLLASDSIAIPIYLYGGHDTSTMPSEFCNKVYFGCQSMNKTTEGCPTQLVDRTVHGAVCQSALTYCSLARDADLETNDAVQNKSHWREVCHKFDAIAAGFGINQSSLDFYFACSKNQTLAPGCPSNPPIITTPTAFVYGCPEPFLFEAHCGSGYETGFRLDYAQCVALNRGVCTEPNFFPLEFDGISCAQFACPQSPHVTCRLPCTNYTRCFNARCPYYEQLSLFEATCGSNSCLVGANSTCTNYSSVFGRALPHPSCNSTAPMRYQRGLVQNDYAAWVHSKCSNCQAFLLDFDGKAHQECLNSNQLDVVIYPRCKGNYVPPAQ